MKLELCDTKPSLEIQIGRLMQSAKGHPLIVIGKLNGKATAWCTTQAKEEWPEITRIAGLDPKPVA